MTAAVDVSSLSIEVHRENVWRLAVRGISFSIGAGERLAMVGESGSGKSLTALALGRLLGRGARICAGQITVAGRDVTRATAREVEAILGTEVGFVFQDPDAALDPTMPIGRQIGEALEGSMSRRARCERVTEFLARVGIPNPRRRLDDYPHQLSGGMRQRAVIAAALVNQPQVLIADEPTSALDVTVQAQVLDLLNDLSSDMGLAVLFITHDLAVARAVADRVCVMYAGVIVEQGPADVLLQAPDHPYSQALLALAPRLNAAETAPRPIPGSPTPGWLAGAGCPFAPRCRFAAAQCSTTPFLLAPIAGDDHQSACIRPLKLREAV